LHNNCLLFVNYQLTRVISDNSFSSAGGLA